MKLNIYPDQVRYIPANVGAEIKATTIFGAKYVNLLYPTDPSPNRLAAGQVIRSQNVSTEVNTVFQNLTDVLKKIDTSKLNASTDRSGRGPEGSGRAFSDRASPRATRSLKEINPRADTVRRDFQALKGFSDAYGAAAHDILTVLDAASTTSTAITDNAATWTRCSSASPASPKAVSICSARARTTWSAPSTCSNRRRAC